MTMMRKRYRVEDYRIRTGDIWWSHYLCNMLGTLERIGLIDRWYITCTYSGDHSEVVDTWVAE